MQSIVDSLQFVLPEAALIATACVLFLGAAFSGSRHVVGVMSLIGLIVASGIWWHVRVPAIEALEASPFLHDDLTWFIKGVGLAAGLILVLASWNQVDDEHAAEYQACLLVIIAGTNFVAASNELVTLFLALELISIPTYVLLYLPKHTAQSQEAATKYFLLSVFSSALLLYGFSFLYGSVGSTNLAVIQASVQETGTTNMPGVLIIALVTIVAGLSFRITAVPFHFYAPDVYQGAPTIGAALLAFIPKVAGFMALYRVITATLLVRDWALSEQATHLFWILAAVTMCLGNFMALLQDNIKRLLAYSSVSHAGYMLVGLGAGASANAVSGIDALFFYLIIYGAMTIGVFAVVAVLSKPGRSIETVDDLAGIGWSHPALALMMALFLFSLTGLPPTAGFWGKLNIFFAAWSNGSQLFRILAVLMAVNAAVGGWYYLRIVAAMYLRQPVKPLAPVREVAGLMSLALCTAVVIGLFVSPGPVWKVIEKTTRSTPSSSVAVGALTQPRSQGE